MQGFMAGPQQPDISIADYMHTCHAYNAAGIILQRCATKCVKLILAKREIGFPTPHPVQGLERSL